MTNYYDEIDLTSVKVNEFKLNVLIFTQLFHIIQLLRLNWFNFS